MNVLKTWWRFAACLCVLRVLAGTNVAGAQDGAVAGRVTSTTGDPMPGANIVLLDTTYGDAASADGTYRIGTVPVGSYRIQASSVGFEAKIRQIDVVANETVHIDFVLEPIAVESREIVVTTTRRDVDAGNTAASISVLTADDLAVRNILALDDALRYVPGVQLTGNEVNIRGASGFSYNTGSRVLLLVDGMPMLSPDAERIPFDLIPVHQIERVEVFKGPGSALYGGGALGGIIHVITKTYPAKPETFVEAYGGAYQPARHAIWHRQWKGAKNPRPLGGVAINHARPLSPNTGLWTNLTYRYDASHLNMNSSRSLQGFSKFTWRTSPDSHVNILAGVNRKTSNTFIYWNGARDALNPGSINIGGPSGSSGTITGRSTSAFCQHIRTHYPPVRFFRRKYACSASLSSRSTTRKSRSRYRRERSDFGTAARCNSITKGPRGDILLPASPATPTSRIRVLSATTRPAVNPKWRRSHNGKKKSGRSKSLAACVSICTASDKAKP